MFLVPVFIFIIYLTCLKIRDNYMIALAKKKFGLDQPEKPLTYDEEREAFAKLCGGRWNKEKQKIETTSWSVESNLEYVEKLLSKTEENKDKKIK